MGKTSAAVKNRYAAKAYDRLNIIVPKGQKEEITEHAKTRGQSLNGFVKEAIEEKIERDRRDRENGAT